MRGHPGTGAMFPPAFSAPIPYDGNGFRDQGRGGERGRARNNSGRQRRAGMKGLDQDHLRIEGSRNDRRGRDGSMGGTPATDHTGN